MFRVTFITDDKRLAKAHKALVGIAIGRPEVDVLTDVSVTNGKAERALDLDLQKFFADFPPEFRTALVVDTLKAQGRASNSGYTATVLNRAMKLKLIKRKKIGQYTRIAK